jgi:anaerobic magnesium-protoporphyrin IX monomethyl ester cyclase
MRHILIHPPFADPTQPYVSLPTLKGHLRARDLEVQVVDLNVEAVHELAGADALREIAVRVGNRFLDLNERAALDFEEQREFRRLVLARPWLEDLLGAERSPLDELRDPEAFYDATRYERARTQLDALFTALSAAYFPYRFGFNRLDREVVPWSFDLLDEYAGGETSPCRRVYSRVFEAPEDWNALADMPLWIDASELEFAGISVVFPSQIPEALHLARYLRGVAPNAFLAFGGPAIHQIAVHMDADRRRRLLASVDGIGLFEGEPLLEALLPRLSTWRQARDAGCAAESLSDIPNLLSLDARGEPRVGVRRAVALDAAEPPDYSDLDLDRYLAPSRTLLYAPTRGCYWGKCSFCYYGLAETATAAYREIPPERVAADLIRLSKRHGVRNFYLSCDVLAPRYALRLAEALIARDAHVKWHCDLKIEPYFTPERVATLHRGGLRAAAFGIESGSDRILALMRKGSDRATMTTVNRWFAEAGIATQWMTFSDHPTETPDEALATVGWIEGERSAISLFLVGEFGLEAGSDIARDPQRYGIESIWFAAGDDLRLYALYREAGGRRRATDRARVDDAIARAAAPFAARPYPWAGAISTHHSFLHFLRFGRDAFKTHFRASAPRHDFARIDVPISHVLGMRRRPRFAVDRIEANEDEFFARFLPKALFSTLPARRGFETAAMAPLTLDLYREASAEVEPLRPATS